MAQIHYIRTLNSTNILRIIVLVNASFFKIVSILVLLNITHRTQAIKQTSLLSFYYRSLVTQTDPYLAKPYVDILLPEFTHQETLLFSQFLYSGELRYKEWGGAEELF